MDLTVMAYATVGLSLLVSAIKAADWILNTDPRTIISAGRWSLITFVVLAPMILLWLIVSGRWIPAMMLATFMLPVLVKTVPRWRALFARFGVGVPGFGVAFGSPAMEHEAPNSELVRQSIAVLRAYPDHTRRHIGPSPIDVNFGSGSPNALGSRMRMSTEEAHDVLGLTPTASALEIMEAYRRLEQKISPEFGGTHYLHMKINQARDVLLGSQTGFA